MISLAPVLGFSVLGIPSGDTQNTSDLGTGVPKTRGYPNHCNSGPSQPRSQDLFPGLGNGPGNEVGSELIRSDF